MPKVVEICGLRSPHMLHFKREHYYPADIFTTGAQQNNYECDNAFVQVLQTGKLQVNTEYTVKTICEIYIKKWQLWLPATFYVLQIDLNKKHVFH